MKTIKIELPKAAVTAGDFEDVAEGDLISVTITGKAATVEGGKIVIDATKVEGDSKPGEPDDDEGDDEDRGDAATSDAQATAQDEGGTPKDGSGEAAVLAREIGEAKGGPAVAYVLGKKRGK